MAKKTVFISHISDESEIAQALKSALDRDFLGLLEIFVSSDRETIKASKNWLLEIEKALKTADLQIVLCSRGSVGRPWVNFEAGAAWLRGVPILPACHTDMKASDLPVPLSLLQAIEVGQPEGLQKLYDVIALLLEAKAPPVDLTAIARELRGIEKQYASRNQLERVENPNVLCAASEQYAQFEMGFHLDEQILERVFPGRVTIERALTSKRLRELLLSPRHFDIVHLVLAVDRHTGDLVFSPIDFATYQPATLKPDVMSPSAFANLLRESQTKLAVLATCKALRLAVAVAHVANMAASDADLTGEQAAEWEDFFYGLLGQGKSLYKAFELAQSQINTAVLPVRHRDMVFAQSTDAEDASNSRPQPSQA